VDNHIYEFVLLSMVLSGVVSSDIHSHINRNQSSAGSM